MPNKKDAAANEAAATTEQTAPATTEQNNNAPALMTDTFNKLAEFEKQDTGDLIELTSELLKLEAGEAFNGILTNNVEMMQSQDEGGEPFPCAVLYAKNKSKVLCADAVVISTQKRLFASVPEGDQAAVVVRIESRGMRKSASNSKNEYRDLKIYTL